MKFCKVCSLELGPYQRSFCSLSCKRAWEVQPIPHVCSCCGKDYSVQRNNIRRSESKICRSCRSRQAIHKAGLVGNYGSKNPAWKGGYRYYSSTRFGSDSAGFQWKVQRRLALQRDSETCQICGKYDFGKRKPDVHHIVPWRVSFSHALDNLICLCKSCHRLEDAKVDTLWCGELPSRLTKETKCGCAVCSNTKRHLNTEGICRLCQIKKSTSCARTLIESGVSHSDAARRVGINRTALYKYLKDY